MKIGDRVMVKPNFQFKTIFYNEMRGKVGTVTWCADDSNFIDVRFDNNITNLIFYDFELTDVDEEFSDTGSF